MNQAIADAVALRAGGARVLNAHVYWFALPALFVTDTGQMSLDRGKARFVLACVLPVLGAAGVLAVLSRVFGLARRTFVLLAVSTVFGSLAGLERAVAVLMSGMPVAVSLLVLSKRYDFHPGTIASLVLLSSVGGALTLNLWLLLLA